ncbi:MAG: galactose-1-phosphate uridylyltransferase [Tenericutes bacterium HGW-Tenericutes-2]|jgi:UDPglucose--hexose-1-phosphate uridylyltransferase|nr:MAG: galactose-1-phosphate uridylyltransferase [Tenericutes bacterium HGW-Tenericutes-2]
MEKELIQLIDYAISHQLMDESKINQAIAMLSKLMHIDIFPYEKNEIQEEIEHVLNRIIDYAVANQWIPENNIDERDAYEASVFDCVMPTPKEVKEEFSQLYLESPSKATNYLYKLSKDVNYIKTKRLEKNMHWTYQGLYGKLELTINLSKPEKDPKEIALLKNKVTHYQQGIPLCVICKENEQNYHNARMNLRIVPIILGNEKWHFQYSPYLYYPEHCIILHDIHKPMKICHQTFNYLLDFVDLFPSYFIGSNADLPIVGGSILNHDHFQGGKHNFPIEQAKEIRDFGKVHNVHVSHLFWPLSTIRLKSIDRKSLYEVATKFYDEWLTYENKELNIINSTNGVSHQTITPILRKLDDLYEMDIILRNNRTSSEYPDGIFHPHKEVHHIKKENIGLIEAMGLAILPGRLRSELKLIEDFLKKDIEFPEEIEKHKEWILDIQSRGIKDINQKFLLDEVAKKFEKVIEHSGVFKQDRIGLIGIHQFILQVIRNISSES